MHLAHHRGARVHTHSTRSDARVLSAKPVNNARIHMPNNAVSKAARVRMGDGEQGASSQWCARHIARQKCGHPPVLVCPLLSSSPRHPACGACQCLPRRAQREQRPHSRPPTSPRVEQTPGTAARGEEEGGGSIQYAMASPRCLLCLGPTTVYVRLLRHPAVLTAVT
jgi:hypothetical protein